MYALSVQRKYLEPEHLMTHVAFFTLTTLCSLAADQYCLADANSALRCICCVVNSQLVKASCQAAPGDVLVLPFDLLGPAAQLESAAATANVAFGGNGIDYLIHNAGTTQQLVFAPAEHETTKAAVWPGH